LKLDFLQIDVTFTHAPSTESAHPAARMTRLFGLFTVPRAGQTEPAMPDPPPPHAMGSPSPTVRARLPMPLQIRPAFRRQLPCAPAKVIRYLKRELVQLDAPCTGSFYDRHAILDVPSDDQHFWSPQLSLDFEPFDGGTLIRGLFAPRPSVWTMYVAAYAILGFSGIIALLFGTSQWSLGMEASALWVLPFAGLLAVLVYGTAWAGQRLSRDQMEDLRVFIDDALDNCALRRGSAPEAPASPEPSLE